MYSALTYPKPLAGILSLSSWLPLTDSLTEVSGPAPVAGRAVIFGLLTLYLYLGS
jgi:predicted esterase